MKTQNIFNNSIFKILKLSFLSLPVPFNISFFWNFGSLLGLSLILQIISGIFLAIHYNREISQAFFSVNTIIRDINFGWLIRVIHRNGARIFFFCLYFHIGRGIYYKSFLKTKTWIIGSLIFILTIATAFLGYVLPWGQISFWGATVITNLFSVIPYLGKDIIYLLWGGFSVDAPTLRRFFALHFLIPFIIIFLVIIHLIFLHEKGSSNPLGLKSSFYMVKFHPYFSVKDLLGFLIYFTILSYFIFWNPWLINDPDNFILANSIVTPKHIQPEWYFLFAYAILRSIPRKWGGVLALLLSVLVLFILPIKSNFKIKRARFCFFRKLIFWNLVFTFFLLTWIGARPASGIYIIIGQSLTINYFFFFRINFFLLKLWEKFLMK